MPKIRDQRKSKRITRLKPTRIDLKGQSFEVSDISNDGIGIILTDGGPPFSIGERLAAIPIPLADGAVSVQGVVSHISYTAAGCTCGIHFVFSGDEYDAVMRFRHERTQAAPAKEEE
jgi:hypothetical protein